MVLLLQFVLDGPKINLDHTRQATLTTEVQVWTNSITTTTTFNVLLHLYEKNYSKEEN